MENLKIKGMHCEACKTLIKLELEEAGFTSNIISIELGDNNIGTITFSGISNQELEKAKQIINRMEHYKVENT